MVDLEALANELRAAGENYITIEDGVLKVYSGCTHDEDDDFVCSEEWVCVDNTGDVWTGDLFPGDPMLVYPYLAIIARHLGAGQPVAADRAALVERMAEAAWNVNDRAGRRFARAFPDQRSTYLRSSDAALAAVESAGWGPLPMPIRAILDAPEFTAEEERAMQDLSGPRAEPVAGTGTHAICPGPRLQHDCEKGIVTSYDAHGNVFSRAGCTRCWGSGFAPVAPPEPLSAGEIASIALTAWGASMHGHEISWSSISGADRHRAEVIARAVLAALPARHAVPVEGA